MNSSPSDSPALTPACFFMCRFHPEMSLLALILLTRQKGGGKNPGWMLDPTQRGPPEDNTVKCQRMSPCNAINYTLLYLVLSTGYEIVIKTAYLSLVNMQTDDPRELGPLCDEFRVTISCALRLLSLNKLVRVMQMM